MQDAVRHMIEQHENSALFLVDIGVWPFRDLLEKYPERAKNIGIFEPGTIGIAAGTALCGITPIVYGISPFIVQRSLEQLKLDFVYQNIGGNFITTGASYDFSTLGYSHYCPEDAATLMTLPGMEVVMPGTPDQFTQLFNACCFDARPTYFRMTDYSNQTQVDVSFGKANVLKRGSRATVIAVAEQLDATLEACSQLDVTVLYYTTLAPFDCETLRNNFVGGKVFVSSALYQGSLSACVSRALGSQGFRIAGAEVPLEVLRTYGTKAEKDAALKLDARGIYERISSFLEI